MTYARGMYSYIARVDMKDHTFILIVKRSNTVKTSRTAFKRSIAFVRIGVEMGSFGGNPALIE